MPPQLHRTTQVRSKRLIDLEFIPLQPCSLQCQPCPLQNRNDHNHCGDYGPLKTTCAETRTTFLVSLSPRHLRCSTSASHDPRYKAYPTTEDYMHTGESHTDAADIPESWLFTSHPWIQDCSSTTFRILHTTNQVHQNRNIHSRNPLLIVQQS